MFRECSLLDGTFRLLPIKFNLVYFKAGIFTEPQLIQTNGITVLAGYFGFDEEDALILLLCTQWLYSDWITVIDYRWLLARLPQSPTIFKYLPLAKALDISFITSGFYRCPVD